MVPVLEDAYAVGGELKPFGPGFRENCLRDEPREDGTMLYRSRLRAAIRVSVYFSRRFGPHEYQFTLFVASVYAINHAHRRRGNVVVGMPAHLAVRQHSNRLHSATLRLLYRKLTAPKSAKPFRVA